MASCRFLDVFTRMDATIFDILHIILISDVVSKHIQLSAHTARMQETFSNDSTNISAIIDPSIHVIPGLLWQRVAYGGSPQKNIMKNHNVGISTEFFAKSWNFSNDWYENHVIFRLHANHEAGGFHTRNTATLPNYCEILQYPLNKCCCISNGFATGNE